jgi:hypothetical protein
VVEAITSGAMAAERRADRRYPIHARIEYKLILGRRVARAGTGRLLNISRSGLLFEGAHAIPAGSTIELDVDWPSRTVKMVLHVAGQTVRSQGVSTAVKILRSSFRTYHQDADQGNRPRTPA